MIYTLTMNPAVDYIMTVSSLEKGGIFRSKTPCEFVAAGKGINVSSALNRIGADNTAVCLCGEGFVSDEFVRGIAARGQKSEIIRTAECDTRVNAKIYDRESGRVTEVNGYFSADKTAVARVRDRLGELAADGDFLIMSGSLPYGADSGFYADVADELSQKGATVIVDTSGEPLLHAARSKGVWMITPNQRELSELREFGGDFDISDVSGVNLLATLGEKGAVLTCGENEYVCRPPKALKGYAVGAGDALLAGFVAEYIESRDFEKALSAGVMLAYRTIDN